METNKKAYLLLEDRTEFEGSSFGVCGEVIGEIVFATGMTGYLETLTDPSYYGQIVVQTFPLIGNYGVIPSDFESSSSAVRGYIVREWCDEPSNFRSMNNIDDYLKKQNVIGLSGIDTRKLTKIIREKGVMNGAITGSTDNKEKLLERIREYRIKNAVTSIGEKQISHHRANEPLYKVVLMDFGLKGSIVKELLKRRCDVITVPADTTAEKIMKYEPDGIMLSNGPGDPAENLEVIAQLQKLIESKIPIFGICLGHQLLALAYGAKTEKLKYGHRGANHPVKNLETGRVFITSQNHGYAVVNDSLPQKEASFYFINANDDTCEGIRYKSFPAFSVQFHPEASAGPLDTSFLFEEFINLMERVKANADK
jgi:carbamoyl-phosphate synthase small subunit